MTLNNEPQITPEENLNKLDAVKREEEVLDPDTMEITTKDLQNNDRKEPTLSIEETQKEKRMVFIMKAVAESMGLDRDHKFLPIEKELMSKVFNDITNLPDNSDNPDETIKTQRIIDECVSRIKELPKDTSDQIEIPQEDVELIPDFQIETIIKDSRVTDESTVRMIKEMVEKKLKDYKDKNGYDPSPENVKRNIVSFIEKNYPQDKAA